MFYSNIDVLILPILAGSSAFTGSVFTGSVFGGSALGAVVDGNLPGIGFGWTAWLCWRFCSKIDVLILPG
jgi:hypothetical protein